MLNSEGLLSLGKKGGSPAAVAGETERTLLGDVLGTTAEGKGRQM